MVIDGRYARVQKRKKEMCKRKIMVNMYGI